MKNIINRLLVFGFLTISLNGVAQTQVSLPVGTFAFQNSTELITLKKTELISVNSQSALEHVIELKKQGWTCTQQPGNFNKCWIFVHNESLPEVILVKIQNNYVNRRISFSEVKSLSIINDAEFLQEYDVRQRVEFDNLSSENYLLRVIKDGPVKLQIPFKTGVGYFSVVDNQTMAIYESITTSKKNVSTLYFVRVNFEKIP